jgi:hypothetical protein
MVHPLLVPPPPEEGGRPRVAYPGRTVEIIVAKRLVDEVRVDAFEKARGSTSLRPPPHHIIILPRPQPLPHIWRGERFGISAECPLEISQEQKIIQLVLDAVLLPNDVRFGCPIRRKGRTRSRQITLAAEAAAALDYYHVLLSTGLPTGGGWGTECSFLYFTYCRSRSIISLFVHDVHINLGRQGRRGAAKKGNR